MTNEEKMQRYQQLCHAVQTGIGWTIAIENDDADVNADVNLRAHKHLRTGIDTSKSDFGAMARLLIAKGIFSEDEYIDALIDGMEREKTTYETELSAHFGKPITLA